MGVEANLKVNVEELNTCALGIKTACEKLDGVIAVLNQELQAANEIGLESGQSAEAFSMFVKKISQLNGKLLEAGSSFKSTITEFLDEIDDADDLMFKNKGYKPFTDEEFRACFAVVENTTVPSLDGNSLRGFISKLLDKLIKLIWNAADMDVTVGNDESILRSKVNNLKEKTVAKITTIMAGVRLADRMYRQKLESQKDVLNIYKKILSHVDNIVSSNDGIIQMSELTAISSFWDQYCLLVNDPEIVTDEDVKFFADNIKGYFNSSSDIIISICDASIGQIVTSDFDRYRATVNAARDYFNSYSIDYVQSQEQYRKYKDAFDKILSLYNKYGSKWTDYYNGDKESVEIFNKLVRKTGEVSKKSEDYVNIWFQLFCDMSESKNAFQRFKNNCDLNNESVQKALERVEALYNNEVDAYISDTLGKIAQEAKKTMIENGAEAVTKAYAKIAPNGGIEKIMTKIASEVVSKAFEEAPAVAMYDYILATQNAFDNAIADLKTAAPDSPQYDVLVLTVKESFDAAKNARIDFFTTMSKGASTDQKALYDLNIKSLRAMSLKDVVSHEGVHPSEYYGENSSIFGYIMDADISTSH